MTPTNLKNLQDLIDHLDDFWSSAKRLSFRLIEEGEYHLARLLLANARLHDYSKFFGIEWDTLVMQSDPNLLKTAIQHHSRSNAHHPEYWGSIHNMDDLHIAEMVCDFKARSTKFGSSLVDYIHNESMSRYGFTKTDAVYSKIIRFVNMLVDKPFARIV